MCIRDSSFVVTLLAQKGIELVDKDYNVACTEEPVSYTHLDVYKRQGAGFNDYSNFIRTFKKHTGMTPAAFARASQSGCGGS